MKVCKFAFTYISSACALTYILYKQEKNHKNNSIFRLLGTGHYLSARVGWREYGWATKYLPTNWVGYHIIFAVLGGP